MSIANNAIRQYGCVKCHLAFASIARIIYVCGMDSQERCKAYRRRILELSQRVPALHIGGAFSCLEIVDACYYELMKPGDTFVMSKGHGAIAQYVVLESLGIITDLNTYCTAEGHWGAHPDRGNPGIAASTGALGHGLAMAAGMAHADRTHTVYCLLSDGECQEGSTWEAAMVAANLKLGNLVCFMDNNDMISDGRISERWPAVYPLTDKFEAFGWDVIGNVIRPGHDSEVVADAVLFAKPLTSLPLMIICATIKGRGVSFMENVPMWHYRSPSKEEYERAMRELA